MIRCARGWTAVTVRAIGLVLAVTAGAPAALSQAGAGLDERIAELQRQIDRLQKELDALRAERSGTATDLATERSVKPGINESWKSDRIDPLIGRLEAESREIHTHRKELAALVGPLSGAVVADVGAGSGFMAEQFAGLVGEEGRVVAVDINPVMMEHVASNAKEHGITNLETVVCGEKSVGLPPASVDLVFLCDTYHHFEYPRNTLRTIHEALRPGGQLVVVEFHRIPGVSRDWMLEHVRAGEEVFTEEIVDSGFHLLATHYPSMLEENYVLRFLKVEAD